MILVDLCLLMIKTLRSHDMLLDERIYCLLLLIWIIMCYWPIFSLLDSLNYALMSFVLVPQ